MELYGEFNASASLFLAYAAPLHIKYRYGQSRSRSGSLRKRKNLFFMTGNKPKFVARLARTIVTIQNDIF